MSAKKGHGTEHLRAGVGAPANEFQSGKIVFAVYESQRTLSSRAWKQIFTIEKFSQLCTPRMAHATQWLVLVRETLCSRVDIIGAHLSSFAMAIFPWGALCASHCSLPLIIEDNSSERLVCWLSMLLSGIPNQWVRFWLTKVQFSSQNRCEMRSKDMNWDTITLQIRSLQALVSSRTLGSTHKTNPALCTLAHTALLSPHL